MTNEVMLAHRHVDTDEPMRHVEDERVDGLRVSEYTCSCGFGAAVLSRVDEEKQGPAGPTRCRRPPRSHRRSGARSPLGGDRQSRVKWSGSW